MDRPLRQQGAQTYPEVQILQEQGQMVHGLTHEGAQGLVDAARGGMRQAQHAARALVDLYRQADDGLEIGHARQFAEQHGGRGGRLLCAWYYTF